MIYVCIYKTNYVMQTDQIVATLNAKRVDMHKVPSSKLRIKTGLNIRSDYGNIEELAESIKENGIRVPVRGYKEKEGNEEVYVITDGHRRTLACRHLLKEGTEILVPFVLEHKGYSDEQRLIDMFIMNEGKSLTPLEQAEGVRRFIAYGYSEKEIAGKLAKSEGYIRKLNSLNSAPKKFIQLIEKGYISATLAIQVIADGLVDQIIAESEGKLEKAPADDSAEMHQATDGSEIKDVQPSGQSGKITKKDLQTVNSLKEFKKFMKKADENIMNENVVYIYQFATKLANNELSFEQIEEFFK
jgi:ParB/RepB/Spo0J family partition protein